jgi:hypothetical protein
VLSATPVWVAYSRSVPLVPETLTIIPAASTRRRALFTEVIHLSTDGSSVSYFIQILSKEGAQSYAP